jgi:hypothetical protein
MCKSNFGDDNYFSTFLKMNSDTGIIRFLGHEAKPLRFYSVGGVPIIRQQKRCLGLYNVNPLPGGPMFDFSYFFRTKLSI